MIKLERTYAWTFCAGGNLRTGQNPQAATQAEIPGGTGKVLG